jgi:SAM-dependent methyltransferase
VNIDAYDGTIADQVMSVTSLNFDDATFSQVDCIQVMEHLGAAKSIYALSEIFRVLKPGGSFLIETPDLLTAFKSFIKGDENSRKLTMNWIFGLDIPGMSHKYGFPEELLERILLESGFVDVDINQVNPKSVHPSLRAICKKSDSEVHQAVSKFRRTLMEDKMINLDDQVEVMEKEATIQKLIQLTLKTEPTFGDRYLKALAETSATCSPKIGVAFLQSMRDSKLLTSEKVDEHIKMLKILDSVGFVDVLTNLFYEMPIKPGFHSETFDTVLKLGKQSIGKLSNGDQTVIREIEKTATRIQNDDYNDYFSKVGLELISHKKLAHGLKAFGLEQLEDANTLLHDAIRFNRDSIISYWNLARLSLLMEDLTKMNQFYSTVSSLLMQKHPKSYRNYQKMVEEERDSAIEGNVEICSEPIFSY